MKNGILLLILFSSLSPLSAQEATTHETSYLRLIRTGEALQFYLVSNPDRAVLTLPLDRPFLEGVRGEPKVKFRRGSFHFKNRKRDRCRDSRIDRIEEDGSQLLIDGFLCETSFRIRVGSPRPDQLWMQIALPESPYNQLTFRFGKENEEGFFGLGAQYSHLRLDGHRIPVWVGEQGIGRGDQPITTLVNLYGAGGDPFTTSMPIPWLMSTYNRGIHLANRERMVFDLRKKREATVEVWSDTLEITVWQDEDPLELLKKYTWQTGRLPALPDWGYGTIVGLQGGRDTVLRRIDRLQEAGCPVDAVWIQDWVGQRQTFFGSQLRWYWEADPDHYPDFPFFCKNLNDRGIAVLGYINPFITDHGPLFETARDQGYLVRDSAGAPYRIEATGFDCYLFDLTNPAAFEWVKDLIKKNMIAPGLSGWMADFGEWLPWDAMLHSGAPASTYHNQYPVDWARLNREAIREAGKEGEIAFFARAAFTGSNRYSNFYWLGDQLVNWGRHDGLPSVVPALISGGLSGLSINHADVGGFTSIKQFPVKITRKRELLKRWIELGAFTPVFRTHESVRPALNLQVYDDADIRQFYARFARLHGRLRPYLEACVKEAAGKGYPVIRHLYLHYPDDPEAADLPYQYLLGPDLLVAPVLKKGRDKQDVYFPAGTWRHLFTGQRIHGPRWEEIAAPTGTPPVFLKEGGAWEGILEGVAKE